MSVFHVPGHAITSVLTQLHLLGAINRHEDYYNNPHIFDPERYILSEFGTKPDVDTSAFRNDMIFGAGRVSVLSSPKGSFIVKWLISQRICPGKHLASTSIVSVIASCIMLLNTWRERLTHPGAECNEPTLGVQFPSGEGPAYRRAQKYWPEWCGRRKFASPLIPTSQSQRNLISQGLFLKLRPFDCEIVPRSAEKADMIRVQFVEAKSTFELFDRQVPETTL